MQVVAAPVHEADPHISVPTTAGFVPHDDAVGFVPVAFTCPEESIWKMLIGAVGLEDTLPSTLNDTAEEVAPVVVDIFKATVAEAFTTERSPLSVELFTATSPVVKAYSPEVADTVELPAVV